MRHETSCSLFGLRPASVTHVSRHTIHLDPIYNAQSSISKKSKLFQSIFTPLPQVSSTAKEPRAVLRLVLWTINPRPLGVPSASLTIQKAPPTTNFAASSSSCYLRSTRKYRQTRCSTRHNNVLGMGMQAT